MKNQLFEFQVFIELAKTACTCKQYLGCLENAEEHTAEAFGSAGCDPSKECSNLKDIVKYEKNFGLISDDHSLEDTAVWEEYLSRFNLEGIEFRVPEELKEDFNYKILYALILGSHSSEYSIRTEAMCNNEPAELYIHVVSENDSITRPLSGCWSSQIYRLFEIYILEQFRMMNLAFEDKEEHIQIVQLREARLKKWDSVRSRILKRSKLYFLLDS